MFYAFLACLVTHPTIDLDALDVFQEGPLAVHEDTLCLGRGTSCVLRYPDGRSVVLGRQGSGPGEFERIDLVSWSTADEAFLVYDGARGRLSVWGTDGRLRHEAGYTVNGDPRYLPVFLSSDTALVKDPDGEGFFLDGVDGRVRTRYSQLPELDTHMSSQVTVNGRHMDIYYTWDPSYLVDLGPRIRAVCPNLGPTLYLFEGQAKTMKAVPFLLPRQPIDEADVARVTEEFKDLFKTQNLKVDAPKFWPMVRTLVVDDQDRIWLFSYPAAGQVPYLRFDVAGTQNGKGEVRTVPLIIEGQKGYAYDRDEDRLVLHVIQMPR